MNYGGKPTLGCVCLLEDVSFDNLDSGMDDQKGCKSLIHGVMSRAEQTSSFQHEIDVIAQHLDRVER
jgi:hypothetical protein